MDLATARQIADLIADHCYESNLRQAIIDDLRSGVYHHARHPSLLALRVAIAKLCDGAVPEKITQAVDDAERRFAPNYTRLTPDDVEELRRAATAALTGSDVPIHELDLTGTAADERDREAVQLFCQVALPDSRFTEVYRDEAAIEAAKAFTAADVSDASQQ